MADANATPAVGKLMAEITRILEAIDEGDVHAAEELLPLIYDALRQLAAQKLSREKPGQTLQATALVHEAYIRLVDVEKAQHWNSRAHFFGAAAEAMRRILVENARRKSGPEAGGKHQRVDLSHVDPEIQGPPFDLLALNDALETLSELHPRAAELVKLRFFAGLSNEQAAKTLDVSPSTAYEDWAYAKCWLRVEMSGAPSEQA